MEAIEWSRLMASLLPAIETSSISELTAAASTSFSTSSRLTFNHLENLFKILKNICIIPLSLIVKFCMFRYYTTTNHANLHEYENDEKKQKTPLFFKHELS